MNRFVNSACIGRIVIILSMMGITVQVRSQCDPEPHPTNTCESAPIACFEGQCYTTAPVPPDHPHEGWCGPNTAVHNPQYFSFTAASSIVRIHILVDTCNFGGCGLQAAILDGCPWDNSNVIACDPGTSTGGMIELESSDMETGSQYWLLIDGCAGGICQYEFILAEGLMYSSTTIDTTVCGVFNYKGGEYPPGTYQFEYMGSQGCDSIVTITVHSILEVNLGSIDICFPFQEPIIIDPEINGINDPFTYIWHDGSTDSVFLITDPVEGDTISVMVTDAVGCSVTAQTIIGSTLSVELVPDNITICPGNPIGMEIAPLIFGGTFPYEIIWILPSGDTVFSNFLSVTDTGLYRVILTDSEGCQDDASMYVNEALPAEFELGTYPPFCPDSLAQGIEIPAVISPDIVYFTFMGWSGPPFVVDHPGIYSVTATDVYGCKNADTLIIEAWPSLPESFEVLVCGDEARFYSEPTGAELLWDFGDGGTDTIFNPVHVYEIPGTYTVQLTTWSVCDTTLISQLIDIASPDPPINIACETAVDLGMISSRDVECTQLVDTLLFTCTSGSNAYVPPIEQDGLPCSGFHDPAVWYAFETDGNADVLNITINHEDFPAASIRLFESVDGTCGNMAGIGITEDMMTCIQSSDGKLLATNTSVKPLTRYYLVVGAINSIGGDFELCINTVKTSDEPCVTDRDLEIVSRSFDGPLEGPFFPGEEIRICMNVNNYKVDPGEQSCQWFQGIVPVFGTGWEPSSFDNEGQPGHHVTLNGNPMPASNVENSGVFDWWTNVRYHHAHCYYLTENIDNDPQLDMCHGLLDANCLSTGTTEGCCGPCWGSTAPDQPGSGTPLPPGWFSSGVDGSCGGLVGWPAVDWGDGNTCSGSTGPWQFCFNLRVRSMHIEGSDDLSVGFFTFADGEVGSWTGGPSVCGDDLPVLVKLPACWEDLEFERDTLDPVCSGTLVTIDPEITNADVWSWTVDPPGAVTGFSEGHGICTEDVTDTVINAGSDIAFVTYVFTGYAGPCPVIVKEIVVPVLPGPEVSLSSSLGFCHSVDSISLSVIVDGTSQYDYVWWNGEHDTTVVIYNPMQGDFVGVTVTDIVTGCRGIVESFIGDSDLHAVITPDMVVLCPDGAVLPVFDLEITGGTPPYLLQWVVPGDSIPSPLKPPFDIPGVYYLLVTDATQCADTVSFEVVPDQEPVADFSFEAAGQTVTFTNLSENALEYVWSFGDGFTSSDVHPVHEYQDGGDYVVELIVIGHCSNDTVSQSIHVQGVRTEDIGENEKVFIFPNPGKGSFSIAGESTHLRVVRVFDLLGREIRCQKTGENNYTVTDAAAGMYLVFVMLDSGTVVRGLQVQ